MSDDTTQDDTELFDSETPESGADPASTSDDSEEESDTEETEESLDLEDEKPSAKAQKQKQVDTWMRKIERGEASVDDLKKSQQWLKPLLEGKLNAKAKANAKAKELDVDAIIEEKLAAKEDDKQFASLKADLNKVKLSADQKAEIKSEYKDLIAMGASRATALEKSIKYAKIDLQPSSSRKAKMKLPKPGGYKAGGIDPDMSYSEMYENVSEEKRIAHLNALTRT